MSKKQGNIVLTLAPPSNRTPSSTTNTQIQRGIITTVLLGFSPTSDLVGTTYVEAGIVRLGVDPAIAMTILCNGYLTINSLPSFFGAYPILYGDSIQLVAITSLTGITIYADFRFEEEV